MIREIADTPKFKRAYKKFVRHNPALKERIRETLKQMREDVFASRLGTHKLEGRFYGLLACSCGYDCRIVFHIEKKEGEETIIIDSIGTHDQVY